MSCVSKNWTERDLGGRVRHLAHESRYEISGQLRRQSSHQGPRALIGNREMRRAPHPIEGVEIVRKYPRVEQAP